MARSSLTTVDSPVSVVERDNSPTEVAQDPIGVVHHHAAKQFTAQKPQGVERYRPTHTDDARATLISRSERCS
jgi:hypothetical protein